MKTVLYIHGFLSSPQSLKAQKSEAWFKEHYPEVKFLCPQLSSYPGEARKTLVDLIKDESLGKVYAIGSSLGGFWSTFLIEHGLIEKAVLINPGVLPQTRFQEFVGRKVKSYHTEDVFLLTEKDLDDLCEADVMPITQHDKYWLMVQKGDEILDYRLAVDKYQGCRQLVEEGGSHGFDDYEKWLPEIADFFFDEP